MVHRQKFKLKVCQRLMECSILHINGWTKLVIPPFAPCPKLYGYWKDGGKVISHIIQHSLTINCTLFVWVNKNIIIKYYLNVKFQILKLCGARGKRKREDIQIVDVNQQEVLADAREWLLKGLMDDTTKRVSASKKKGNEPTNQQKRKHQITYLAHQVGSLTCWLFS